MATATYTGTDTANTVVRMVLPDHLRSSTLLAQPNGIIESRERYAAFGERRRGETPLTTDRLYTGQRFEPLVGLYHYSDGKSAGRFYDPALSRGYTSCTFVAKRCIIP